VSEGILHHSPLWLPEQTKNVTSCRYNTSNLFSFFFIEMFNIQSFLPHLHIIHKYLPAMKKMHVKHFRTQKKTDNNQNDSNEQYCSSNNKQLLQMLRIVYNVLCQSESSHTHTHYSRGRFSRFAMETVICPETTTNLYTTQPERFGQVEARWRTLAMPCKREVV